MSVLATISNGGSYQAATLLNLNAKANRAAATNGERISSGYKINRGFDDPSGLNISKGMSSRYRSGLEAVNNIQEAIALLQTADSGIGQILDLKIEQKEILTRTLNSATLTGQDQLVLAKDYVAKDEEIFRIAENTRFAGKFVLNGDLDASKNESVHVGVESTDSILIDIPNLGLYGTQPPSAAIPFFELQVAAGNMLTNFFQLEAPQLESEISGISDVQAKIGIQVKNLQAILDDLQNNQINLAAANSRIQDANMAEEIVGITQNQIMSQSGISAIAHAHDALRLMSAAVEAIVDPNREISQGTAAVA